MVSRMVKTLSGRSNRISFTELKAYEWLINVRHLESIELFHGEELGDPDFIYYGTHGFEVKSMQNNSSSIEFERRQYKSLREWGSNCELLVFKSDDVEPYTVIPFSKLPQTIRVSNEYNGITIKIKDTNLNRVMISCTKPEKDELEKIRGRIETSAFAQDDWADILLQSMYCMLSDQLLVKSIVIKRYGVRLFIAECPYCQTDNQLNSKPKLYWLIKCKHCNREFVAKGVYKKSPIKSES